MTSLWERIVGWFGGEDDATSSDVVAVDLIAGLREAADDLHAVGREIDEARAARPDEDFTQARLSLASAAVLELIADTLTEFVIGSAGEMTEGWRARHAEALYRSVLGLLDRARMAVAKPPTDITAIKARAVLPSKQIALDADVTELLRLDDRLQAHHDADIAYARVSRKGAELLRLNELTGLLRSRANLGRVLPSLADDAAAGPRGSLGRAALGELLALWFLIAQELVVPNITAELSLSPEGSATGKYAADNVWMMTDPVAKARYEAAGTVNELAEDIRIEVLRGRPFGPDDIAFAQQIDWLEETKVVARMASYWGASPHSPIYRAKQAGEFTFSSGSAAFARGDRIVWLCQMGKEMADVELPVLIGDLQSASMRQLCGEMKNAMMGAKMKRGGMDEMS